MAKLIPDAVLDLMLEVPEGTELYVCTAEPTSRANAIALALAMQAITGANYALAAGDVSGRKNTLTPPTGSSITATGTANHVAITDATDLLLVTTATPQALTSGGTVDVGLFAHEILDPT